MKNSFYKSMAVGFFLMALSLTGYSQLLPTEVQLAGTFEFGGSDDSFYEIFWRSLHPLPLTLSSRCITNAVETGIFRSRLS